MKWILITLLASASLCFAQPDQVVPRHNRTDAGDSTATSQGTNQLSFVEPHYLMCPNPDVSDYRSVVNAEATKVIFERSPVSNPSDVKLYVLDLLTNDVYQLTDNFPSTRPDWCWHRSGGGFTSGPIAFSNNQGIFRVDVSPTPSPSVLPILVPDTSGMAYPAWYPDCQHLAVVADGHVDAEIDAFTGQVIVPRLANDLVWAGFPSVNQVNPNLIAFAGQWIGDSTYYDQNLNYIWVTERTPGQPRVAPLDRRAPRGGGFLQRFQARAGWWSPDGNWFVFESNRICNDIAGATYALFIQDAKGLRPPMQVTDCRLNVQHAKWFPPRNDGTVLLIAAVQENPEIPLSPYRLATFDVTAFVPGARPSNATNQAQAPAATPSCTP
jgi:Tol biopolymer transport system component